MISVIHFRTFATMLLLLAFRPVLAADPAVLFEKVVVYNAAMQSEINELLTIVKSQKAGTLEERVAFLSLTKPHLKLLAKNLKKCEKTTNKIDAGIPSNDEDLIKACSGNRKLLYESRLFHDQAVEQIPKADDTDFLKSLTLSIKYFSQMSDKLSEHEKNSQALKSRVSKL